MQKEMTVTVGNEKIRILMQDGFFNMTAHIGSIHKHQYTEIQTVVSGETKLQIDNHSVFLTSGDMVIIPPKMMHHGYNIKEGTQRIAFQISKPITEYRIARPGDTAVQLLTNTIQTYIKTGSSPQLESCLSLMCSELFDYSSSLPKPITDRGHIINEFFSENYSRDAFLSELADALGVCEKQASRLVQKYTGNTFQSELIHQRLETANYLKTNQPDLNLEKIAELVGYKSYNGFWKAVHKMKSNSTLS